MRATVRFAVILAAAVAATPAFIRQSALAQADKAAIMRGHYAQVLVMHAAVIRGDVPAIAAPARELVQRLAVPTNPPAPQATVDEMRFAARWAADTSNLVEERLQRKAAAAADLEDSYARAAAYASILAECSGCHGKHAKIWGPVR